MTGVEWIKLYTDMFDNRKIKHLRRLPEGDDIVLIWIMLLTLAGRCNSNGLIFLTETIPYTPEMLADELGFDEDVITLALDKLAGLDMVQKNADGILAVIGWAEHQNFDRLAEIREYNRLAKQKSREKQKFLQGVNDKSMTCQRSQSTEEEKEKEIEEDNYTTTDVVVCRTKDVRRIIEAWNSLGLQQLRKVTSNSIRGGMLRARITEYTTEGVLEAIEKVRNSTFLRGQNKKGWQISFEWFLKPNNFIKVIEGNFDNRTPLHESGMRDIPEDMLPEVASPGRSKT